MGVVMGLRGRSLVLRCFGANGFVGFGCWC